MIHNLTYLLSRIEWEDLQDKLIIKEVMPSDSLPHGAEEIEVWRDENHKIRAKMTGKIEDIKDEGLLNYEGTPGEISYGFVIEASNYAGFESYKINGSHFGHVSTKWNSLPGGDHLGLFDAELLTHEIQKYYRTQESPKWHTDWYINGPRGSVTFPRSTKRRLEERFKRSWDIPLKGRRQFTGRKNISRSTDHAFITTKDFKFLIHVVPLGFKPDWSVKLGVEFREEWKRIPSPDERIAIGELLSFLFGRRLMNIGHTGYDELGQPIYQVYNNPWGDNVRAICQKSDLPPIKMNCFENPNTESVIRNLLPKYLALRDELSLSDALWRYWLSRELPLGVELPILASAVEIISKYWFKSKRSKTGGVYMPSSNFERMTEADFDSLKVKLQAAKLANADFKERIMNRFKGAYRMGANERTQVFFEEIRLPIGKAENAAIGARNKMTHDSWGVSDEAVLKALRHSRAYQTLFHRIFLKLLGYRGNYIDYGSPGWPERPITQPVNQEV